MTQPHTNHRVPPPSISNPSIILSLFDRYNNLHDVYDTWDWEISLDTWTTTVHSHNHNTSYTGTPSYRHRRHLQPVQPSTSSSVMPRSKSPPLHLTPSSCLMTSALRPPLDCRDRRMSVDDVGRRKMMDGRLSDDDEIQDKTEKAVIDFLRGCRRSDHSGLVYEVRRETERLRRVSIENSKRMRELQKQMNVIHEYDHVLREVEDVLSADVDKLRSLFGIAKKQRCRETDDELARVPQTQQEVIDREETTAVGGSGVNEVVGGMHSAQKATGVMKKKAMSVVGVKKTSSGSGGDQSSSLSTRPQPVAAKVDTSTTTKPSVGVKPAIKTKQPADGTKLVNVKKPVPAAVPALAKPVDVTKKPVPAAVPALAKPVAITKKPVPAAVPSLAKTVDATKKPLPAAAPALAKPVNVPKKPLVIKPVVLVKKVAPKPPPLKKIPPKA
eukprot:GHVQ01038172.1.p1 GENE.GHVQ01038172.1~~GHVQ01038172.1.p1  ORF type:complete len:441 (+),score=111.68 GHVQ01038172.1:1291-2613(+)